MFYYFLKSSSVIFKNSLSNNLVLKRVERGERITEQFSLNHKISHEKKLLNGKIYLFVIIWENIMQKSLSLPIEFSRFYDDSVFLPYSAYSQPMTCNSVIVYSLWQCVFYYEWMMSFVHCTVISSTHPHFPTMILFLTWGWRYI